MLEDIQNELQAILGKYPEVFSLTYYNNVAMNDWTLSLIGEQDNYFTTLTEVIEHLETKYPNR